MEEKEKNENKEVTPEWATKLQESLDSLPSRLSEVLNPTPSPQEEIDPNAPQEIPVPEIPQTEIPEVETVTEETPKKRKFLDWLL